MERFDEWMKLVDKEIDRIVSLSSGDLADQTYRDWFNDGYTPEAAAEECLENEGLHL